MFEFSIILTYCFSFDHFSRNNTISEKANLLELLIHTTERFGEY